MSFSTGCACNCVPLVARIVLGAAFITAGYQKLFDEETFTGPRADSLRALGVEGSAPAAAFAPQHGSWSLHLASLAQQPVGGGSGVTLDERGQDDQAAGDSDTGQDPPEQEGGEVQDPPDDAAAGQDEETQPPVVQGDLVAKRLYGITLVLHDRYGDGDIAARWFRWGGWLTALVELIGGALILIGLFSRIWGLGLACVMLGAFYLTSLDPLLADKWAFLGDGGQYNGMFVQLALFAMAFGIFLTGPGSVSVDRFLFKGGQSEEFNGDLP